MRTFLRWWETLGRPERIVAMSLATGGVVAIANSTTWAVAVCYMARQKALASMYAQREKPGAEAAEGAGRTVPDDTAAASARGLFAQ